METQLYAVRDFSRSPCGYSATILHVVTQGALANKPIIKQQLRGLQAVCRVSQSLSRHRDDGGDIRRFQLHLAEAGASICNRNRIMTGLRFLFRVTLRRLNLAAEIYHIREPQKIPLVISPERWAPLRALRSRSTSIT